MLMVYFFEVGIISIIKIESLYAKLWAIIIGNVFIDMDIPNPQLKNLIKKYIFLINIIRKFTFINCKKIIVPSNYLKKIISSWG